MVLQFNYSYRHKRMQVVGPATEITAGNVRVRRHDGAMIMAQVVWTSRSFQDHRTGQRLAYGYLKQAAREWEKPGQDELAEEFQGED